ncbi:MAG: cell wall-binding repeat-containing protein, partial [Eggerthellaceae bacterium]|nr:cell wall-binding repeat-containing protein [Eggerthellaceae bacterium]
SASYKVTVNVPRTVTVSRLQGATALDTMRAIVNAGWVSGGTVVLATSEGYWDGLTANGVAGLAGAPIVLTDGGSLSWQARDVISKLKPSKIVVCGGRLAISDAVVASATGAAGTKPQVKRLWGSAADGTACSIFLDGDDFAGGSWSKSAFVCTDNGYWDALSAAPISYVKHMPIFLTTGSGERLSSETLSAMKSGGIESVYVVGGEKAVAPQVVSQLKSAGITVTDRIWGSDAVATSDKVARLAVSLGLSPNKLGVATSAGYWDALAGAALCGKRGSALVIVDGPKAATISGFVKAHKAAISNATIFGGSMAVSNTTATALKKALA